MRVTKNVHTVTSATTSLAVLACSQLHWRLTHTELTSYYRMPDPAALASKFILLSLDINILIEYVTVARMSKNTTLVIPCVCEIRI